MVGNAVPPNLAYFLAKKIIEDLNKVTSDTSLNLKSSPMVNNLIAYDKTNDSETKIASI